jgi:hypothetical protein
MGSPFTLIQGTIFIADRHGNVVGTKQIVDETDQVGDPLKRLAVDGTIRGGNSPYDTAEVNNGALKVSGEMGLPEDSPDSLYQILHLILRQLEMISAKIAVTNTHLSLASGDEIREDEVNKKTR